MYRVQSRSKQVNVGMFCRTKIKTYCLGFSHSIVIVLTGAALFISLFRYGTGENSFVATSNRLKETDLLFNYRLGLPHGPWIELEHFVVAFRCQSVVLGFQA